MKNLSDILKEILQENKNDIPTPLNARKDSVDNIVVSITSQVNACKEDHGSIKNDAFYAGICKDVKQNMHRHRNDSYVALVDCGTREKAGKVESKLEELGFDVGEKSDNGGDEKTTIVYVIKKGRNFKR